MRRRQESPWILAERNRIRSAQTKGVANRIADGETTFQSWRVENTTTLGKLVRLTSIDINRLLDFETGRALPHADELESLAKALRVKPELLMPSVTEPADDERA